MAQGILFILLVVLAGIFSIAIMIAIGLWLKGWSNITFPEAAIIMDIKLFALLLTILLALTLYVIFSLR